MCRVHGINQTCNPHFYTYNIVVLCQSLKLSNLFYLKEILGKLVKNFVF